MATAPATPPGAAAAGHASYIEFYADLTLDPHRGVYEPLLQAFRTRNNPPDGDDLRNHVGNADPTYPQAFLGLQAHATDECGRIVLLVGVCKYPATLGLPSQWDGNLFAFTGDLVGGQITTVNFPSVAFDWHKPGGAHDNIPSTTARVTELLAQNPRDELLGPLPDGDANIRQARTRHMMPLPHRYVSLVLGQDLTPRECFRLLIPEIEANHDEIECGELLDWLTLALIRSANGQPSGVRVPALTAPVADTALHKHRQGLLDQHLPGRHAPAAGTSQSAALVHSVEQVVAEQRLARTEAAARANSAARPKTPLAHFGATTCDTLKALCNVADTDGLPAVWHNLAQAGKRDRLALEQTILAKARDLGMAEQAPVVTPDLAKKVTQLQWAGLSLDDLADGIQPFSITLPDYATADHGREAQRRAETYDLLTSSDTASTLSDAKSLKLTNVVVPTDYLDAKAHLTGLMIIWSTLVGDGHPFVVALGKFVQGYSSREHFYRNRLLLLDRPEPAPALLLRYVQLRVCNYWQGALANQHLPGDPPSFDEVLAKLAFSDTSWVPSLPPKYWRPAERSTATPSTTGSTSRSTVSGLTNSQAPPAEDASQRSRNRVTNDQPNEAVARFKDAASSVRVQDAVSRAGNTPSVTRDGQSVSMCISYHVRGACWRGCPRAADHGQHTAEEDAALIQWCEAAFPS